MTVMEYLKTQHCPFRVTEHDPVYTAEQLATSEHVSPRKVAKPVIVRADGKFYVCVLAADRRIDLYAVQKHLKAKNVRLASEHEMERHARTCSPSLRDDGCRKVLEGVTTVEEVLRVSRAD